VDFELTKEQIMFRDMAREFAEREIRPSIREHDRNETFFQDIFDKMGPLGLCGTVLPQEYGGLEVDYITHAIICESLGWGSYEVAAQIGGGLLPGMPILKFGTEEQKQKYLPPLCKGEQVFSVVAVEPNTGSDPSSTETTAVLDGDEWVINGTKTWATLGNVADVIEFLAQTDKSKGSGGLALFILEKGTPGAFITGIKHKMGQRAGGAAQIRFVNCRIPKENLIGEIGQGLRASITGISDMRYTIAASSVGMAQSCLDICIDYAKQRIQFGKPIGSFQLIQGIIADMAVQIEAARQLVYHTGYLKDKGLPYRKELAIAKLYSTEMAIRVTNDAIRLHGAYGFTDDLHLERCHRTSIGPTIYGGTSEIQRLSIGRELLDINAFS
jgi:alkylation response protein AidB-like acyl-CoA dehydrogenase